MSESADPTIDYVFSRVLISEVILESLNRSGNGLRLIECCISDIISIWLFKELIPAKQKGSKKCNTSKADKPPNRHRYSLENILLKVGLSNVNNLVFKYGKRDFCNI
jgi:hypothetical protein